MCLVDTISGRGVTAQTDTDIGTSLHMHAYIRDLMNVLVGKLIGDTKQSSSLSPNQHFFFHRRPLHRIQSKQSQIALEDGSDLIFMEPTLLIPN